MSPARLDVSDHAKERLKQRGITRQQVRECLIKGTIVGVDIRGRQVREHQIGRKTLVVVYLAIKGGYCVVTAYWKGKA